MRRLMLLGALALCACRHPVVEAPRVLRVLAAADPTFRTRPHWRDLIASRIHAVSVMYDSAFGIRLELAGVSEWNPDGHLALEPRRRLLGGAQSDGNSVFLGFAPADGDSAEPGLAVAFDPRVLVFDFPAKTEERNQAFLAHGLAHLLGAWHSPEDSSLLHMPPGASFDSTARQVIRLTRSVELRADASGLSRQAADRFATLWSGSHADPASNPLFAAYLSRGHELLNAGREADAVESLSRAIELAPLDANAHYMLGRAALSGKRFADAAFEFRQVLSLDPRHLPAWNNLGGSLLQLGQAEPALSAFRKALELDPSNRTIRANIGVAQVRVPGQLDEGIAELQNALRNDPHQPDALQALKNALDAKLKEAPRSEASKRKRESSDKPTPPLAPRR
jgi:Flp pilus assembly protein TadD